jgi:hypothetical protein
MLTVFSTKAMHNSLMTEKDDECLIHLKNFNEKKLEKIKDDPLQGRLLALPTNNGLGWKRLHWKNRLLIK